MSTATSPEAGQFHSGDPADAGRRYRIGRSRAADLILTHPSVSRTHAELIAWSDGCYRLVDSGSRYGTHIEEGGRWIEIREATVEPRQALRFGAYPITLGELLKRLPRGAPEDARVVPTGAVPPGDDDLRRATLLPSAEPSAEPGAVPGSGTGAESAGSAAVPPPYRHRTAPPAAHVIERTKQGVLPMRKGPDGKTIRPADAKTGAGTDDATRKVPRRSIRDRIAGAADDDDGVVTHMATREGPAHDTAGTTGHPDRQAAGSNEETFMPAADKPEPPAAPPPTPPKANAEADPNVTQIYRPARPKADPPPVADGEEAAAEAAPATGDITDPVVGWLVVLEGPGRGAALSLGYGNNRIGRAATEDVVLDFGDSQVSRENHALVTYDGKNRRFYVQQGGGRNLTHVNDDLVMVPVEIKGGEILSLGQTKLRFVPLCGPEFDWQDQ